MIKFINSGMHGAIVDELVSAFSVASTELVIGISLYGSPIPTYAQTSILSDTQKLDLLYSGTGYNRLYTGYTSQPNVAGNELLNTSDLESNLVLNLQKIDRFYPVAVGLCSWFYILKYDRLASGAIDVGSDIGCIGTIGQQNSGADIELSNTTTSLSIPVTFNRASITIPKQFT